MQCCRYFSSVLVCPATKVHMYISNICIYIYIIPVLAIHNYILDMRTTQGYMQKYDAYEHLPRVPWTPPTSTRDVPGASLSSAAMPAKTAKTKKAFLDEKAVHWNMPKSHSAWFKGFWSEVCIQKSVYVYIYTYIYLFAYVTLHYITLHYITLRYITLHYITLHYIPLPGQFLKRGKTFSHGSDRGYFKFFPQNSYPYILLMLQKSG